VVFGRGRKRDRESNDVFGPLEGAEIDTAPVDGEDAAAEDGSAGNAGSGPWDAAHAPQDGRARLDLGALLIPASAGAEIRVEVNEAQQVVAATVVSGSSSLQLLGFAAPRSSGIWDDIRGEIAASVRADGGEAEEVEGFLGTELRARAVGRDANGAQVSQLLRFVGVDGPRWFLRGVFTGPAATDPQQARPLEDIMRDVVVVRGDEAMAPRDALPLRLPREAAHAAEQAAAQAAEAAGKQPSLDPFERGPEITEIR
jgi:hypothetical protein